MVKRKRKRKSKRVKFLEITRKPAKHRKNSVKRKRTKNKTSKKRRQGKVPDKSQRHFGGPATISPKASLGGESLFKARIKVVGIGGGGGSIVSEIGRSLEKATFVIADTDIRALKKRPGIKYFWFGENLTHGLGTGANVDLAKQAAVEAKEEMGNIFKDQDIIIFIASLGGGLGSGATQVFAEAAEKFGGVTFGIFTLPFKFEGRNKHRIAQKALKSLRKSLNVSLTIPNEKIFKIIDANTPITNAFSLVNKSLIESLESLIDLIYNPGIINIDFADLRTILRGVGNLAFLNTIEESGKERAEKICEKILINPLLQSNGFEPEKILFNIAGSQNLSMFEVEKVSRHIASLNPKAKIIFGISKNSKLKNKIKTTILMTGGSILEEAPGKTVEPVEVLAGEETAEAISERPENKEKKKRKKPKVLKPKKPHKKAGRQNKKSEDEKSQEQVFEHPQSLPVFKAPAVLNIIETSSASAKKTIRRSALEIKKAEELEEKKRAEQEKEWEIPAFLRRVKFKP